MSVRSDPWQKYRRFTSARIALGCAGSSLPTAELLRLGLAHTEARDAVHLPLDATLEEGLRAMSARLCEFKAVFQIARHICCARISGAACLVPARLCLRSRRARASIFSSSWPMVFPRWRRNITPYPFYDR